MRNTMQRRITVAALALSAALVYAAAAVAAWSSSTLSGRPAAVAAVAREAGALPGVAPPCAGILSAYVGAVHAAGLAAAWPLFPRPARRVDALLASYADGGCPATAMLVARVAALSAGGSAR